MQGLMNLKKINKDDDMDSELQLSNLDLSLVRQFEDKINDELV